LHLKSLFLIAVNLGLVGLFIYLLRKPGRRSYYLNEPGRFTCLSVAVITLTDELTPGVYAPAAAYCFPGRLSQRYCLGPDLMWRTFHEHRFLG
jgi:hypothetical protein